MKAQIRLAQSGFSYHYSDLTNVHSLMQQIKKDFKIQLQDQKIIVKSGQILKSSFNFQSIQDIMKKTIATNNQASINPSNIKQNQITQIPCLYVYNQKELLKPIQQKNCSDQLYLKNLKEKCKEMSPLAQNSYQFKRFCQKITQKNINSIIDFINKKAKSSFQNIIPKYSKLLDSINERNYSKLQISSLLDYIQNQDKARKLLIRSAEILFEKKTKKKFNNVIQKLQKQQKNENELLLKQNSSYFSSDKSHPVNQKLFQLVKSKQQIEKKISKCFDLVKKHKKEVVKQRFQIQQKITFQIDKKSTKNQKQFEQKVKAIKGYYDQFCEQLIKVYASLMKNKEAKQTTANNLVSNLLLIDKKIVAQKLKIQENLQSFIQMYIELSKIHSKGETQNIKIVFQLYIQIIKVMQDVNDDIKKLQKQLQTYKLQKSQQIIISEFNESKNKNMPLKKSIIKSPKISENDTFQRQKQKNFIQNQQSGVFKQNQNSIPKINSPIKNKVCKNKLKSFNEQFNSKNFEQALKQNHQLSRRLYFNKRLEGLIKYCTNICQKQQQLRRNYRNSKQFEDNKIDLLINFNVPSVEIQFNETTDQELVQVYKRWTNQKPLQIEGLKNIEWEKELVQTCNSVNKTLNIYLAGKSNTTQKEKSLEKILSLLSDTFYKMAKKKVEQETKYIKMKIAQQLEIKYKEKIKTITRQNFQLHKKIQQIMKSYEDKLDNIEINQSNKSFVEQKDTIMQSSQYIQLTKKISELQCINSQLTQQKTSLIQKISSIQSQSISYQQEMQHLNQQMLTSLQLSLKQQIQQLRQQIKKMDGLNLGLNRQNKDLKSDIQKAKKNLVKQVETSQMLCKEIQEIQKQKDFYQKEFGEAKIMMADKQVSIIKFQKQNQSLKLLMSRLSNSHAGKQSNGDQTVQNPNISATNQNQIPSSHQGHQCQCSQIVQQLRQQKQLLQQQIQQLDKQLKQILFKETLQQQVQTQIWNEEKTETIINDKENIHFSNNISSHDYDKEPKQKMLLQNISVKSIQNTKKLVNRNGQNIQEISITNNYFSQKHAISHYYLPNSQNKQTEGNFLFSNFSKALIGKTIEEGMCHMFLPFSLDYYIGVTLNQDHKNFTSYQDYLSQTQSLSNQSIYLLDTKQFSLRTNQMLRQCSLVLIVKVQKKQASYNSRKVLVSGKICYAFGFQDDDMSIKNYSSFLQD